MNRFAHRAVQRAAALSLGVLLVWAAGCRDRAIPTAPRAQPPADSIPGLHLSGPVPARGAAGASGAMRSASASGTLVYVSLPPNSVPTGLEATIRDGPTGQSVSAALVDGGFDPVGLPASVGDTLTVDITRAGAGPLHGLELVKAHTPPVVVRTDPPPQKVDVPLNAVIVVVFSNPIDSATLNTGSVQLWRDTTAVAGTVRLGDSIGLRVEFHPDGLLAVQTAYRLVATSGVHDVEGVALASTVSVQFTTGTALPWAPLVFASVSVGDQHACGVTTGGIAYCWGNNSHGQLGNGTTASSFTPMPVIGGLTFKSVSAGRYGETCGVTTDSVAYCWGLNMGGQLGYGTTPPPGCSLDANWMAIVCPEPVPVAGGLRFVSVSAGAQFSCGVTASGAAYCWGADIAPLGVDITQTSGCGPNSLRSGWWCPAPVPVSGGLHFTSVDGDYTHMCGLTGDSRIYCWGDDQYGELGDARRTGDSVPCCAGGSVTPVAVSGGLSFTTLSANLGRTCAVAAGGAAYCWGFGGSRTSLGVAAGLQLCESDYVDIGFDNWIPCSFAPIAVSGGLAFATVAVGGLSCGLTTSGSAYCWGADTTASSAMPAAVAPGLTFATLSALSAVCGVSTGGVAYCWGDNSFGQLGNGTTASSSVPVKVAGQP